MFCKKGVLKNFANFIGKQLCESLFFNKVAGLRSEACNLIKKETLAQVFSCEICEIFKNTFFYRIPPVAASEVRRIYDVKTHWVRFSRTFTIENWYLLQVIFLFSLQPISLMFSPLCIEHIRSCCILH